ncbi:MAG: hypothetical protein IK095_06595 [Oscillospiraceae bacterium]|nr:hypothetical protein [Oscillospiraceae bacterium]
MKMSNAKKLLALLLAMAMIFALAACGAQNTPAPTGGDTPKTDEPTPPATEPGTEPPTEEPAEPLSYTYNTYSSSLGNNWNPHTWETNADDAVNGYITSPFVTMSILDSEEGVYQWVYEMATEVTDVTADHQDDLTKYAVILPEGQTAEDTTEGYVFEIKLNPNAKWANGEAITADDYIYSMKQLLAPEMHNYRANLYVAGESAVAGGASYYYQGTTAYLPIGVDTSTYLENGAVEDLFVDTYNFWGAEGYIDAEGNETPQYLSVLDEVAYSADGAGDDEYTGAALYEYFAPGGPYEGYASDYLFVAQTYEDGVDYDTVGCYKVDDYTIIYVNQTQIDFNYFLTSLTSTWLVYEDLYEAGKDTSGELVTTNYGTSPETTMAYGPYMLESMQADKQMVFVQNPYWYGWEDDGNGNLVSYTNFEVDGEKVQQYQTTRVVIDVMDDNAAKQAFLKGELSTWSPNAEELVTYAASDQLYKVDETYTMSFFFNTNVDALKAMDESKGNTNSVVLSNVNFRKAFSLAIDRAEWVTATSGFKPAFSLLNKLYFYDIYNDPTSSYRNSDEAMTAIVNLYGVEYGEGKAYATLKEAHDSINGYNLTEAKELMKTACEELVAEGLYTEGEDIVIRVGYKKGTLDSADNNQMALMNKYINAAVEGSGFGAVTLEAVGNIDNRYAAVPNGEFAIGYGAWGGAAFYPFRNMQVYCDPDQYDINELADWDPKSETLTIDIDGEEVTMTWQAWSGSCVGSGRFATADFATKLHILSTMEEQYLAKYYRIPLAGSTACELLSFKNSYYTDEYNIMYDFGGLRLMRYNYSDAEWTEFVASQGGELHYE